MPSSDAPIITGFYRYTDILWEWDKVIPDQTERSALKGFLSNKSLTHPDSPLIKPGDDGLELYIGTLPNGQLRLMFSSAQVDYVRYWLYTVGLTKALLPLPSSDYLLTKSILKNWSAVKYKSPEDLKKAMKTIDKNNRKLKGADPEMMASRTDFDRTRNLWAEKRGTWIAIDFEGWEMEHSIITEFGYSYIRWVDGKEETKEGHFINDSYYSYRNGKYVADYKDRYNFGVSERLPKNAFKQGICGMIGEAAKAGAVFLAFHDGAQDLKYLASKAIEAPIQGYTYILPDSVPTSGIFVVDTSEMFGALEGQRADRRSLGQVCSHLQMPTFFLHNAGNDAHFVMEALKAMASGEQVDLQRQARWPDKSEAQTGSGGLRVNFNEWEKGSDYSDTEGILNSNGIKEDDEEN